MPVPDPLSLLAPRSIPEQAIQLAMDRKDREREMVSALLPSLVPSVVSRDQVSGINLRCRAVAGPGVCGDCVDFGQGGMAWA